MLDGPLYFVVSLAVTSGVDVKKIVLLPFANFVIPTLSVLTALVAENLLPLPS
jgi:hypothetical protein